VLTGLLSVAGCQDVFTQRLLCVAIQSGETVAQVARRITGEAENAQESWFQILNPETSQFVSKSRYDRIPAGWRACIVNEPVAAGASPSNTISSGAGQYLRTASNGAVRLVQALDPNVVLWGLLLASIALMSRNIERYFSRRASVLTEMKHFGERFVHEFEQPLIDPYLPGHRPIQSRLRFAPHRSRVEILLAPGAGHRYPNLADHRKNVEYDVARVLLLLRDHPFVNGRPYARGRWVVVPFQLNVGITQAGGT